MRRLLAVLLLTFCLVGPAFAGLAGRIGEALKGVKRQDYAIHVVEPESAATVYSFNARQPLIPASNMKLITTAAAVRYLGAGFEYKTRVGLSSDTLVVIGSGDPLLGDAETDARYNRPDGWVFDNIVQTIRDRRVEEINDIIIDTTIFDDERVHPNWLAKDLNRWYACEVCGLNYNDNCIEVTTNNIGGVIDVRVEPRTSFIELINEIRPTAGTDGGVGAYRNSHPNKITLRGKCKTQEGPFKVAIEEPAAFFGFLMAERLAQRGIPAHGRLIEKPFDDTEPFKLLIEFTTPLEDCLLRANRDSLGLVAEALLKTIAARENNGTDGSWDTGRELLGRYLSELGIDATQFIIDDGSGLSRENRLSATAITTVLLDLYKSDHWKLFRDSLAVAGEDGTIERYFKESKYRGNILAKTGYVSGVRSLSGVCLTDNGPYIFSILSNRYSLSRDAINNIARAIIDEYAGTD